MSGKSISDKYRLLLLEYANGPLLEDARARRKPEARYGAVAGYPAAYFATHEVPGGEGLFGSKELLAHAKRCGDFFRRDWVKRGRTTFPNEHFATTFFVDLFGLMKERLDAGRLQRWRETIVGHCESLSTTLERKLSAERTRHTALEVGCGPNHLYCWAAMLYKGGVVLDNDAYRRRAQWSIHRLLEAYDEAGFHPEHIGPVVQYHVVTLSGLSQYYRLSRDPVCEEPLRRGADFWCRIIYPDLSPIEVFDERNRWSPNYALAAHGALQMTPVGRRYIELSLDSLLSGEAPRRPRYHRHHRRGRRRRHRHGDHIGRHAGWILRHLLYYEDGPRKTLPIERERMLTKIDGRGLVRRSGPWVHALSAFCNEPWETNPFILDRVQNLSCWHAKTGLVIGGGNDKHAPEVATFYALEGGFVGYYRPRSGRIVTTRAGDRVELDYGPIAARLTAKVVDDRTLRLKAELDHWVLMLAPYLNLQLQLRAGDAVTLGSGKSVKLSRGVARPRVLKTGGYIDTGRWKLTGPADMTLKWPHMPYNSYRIERHTHIAAAVSIATIPLPAEGGTVELDLKVP